MRGRFVLKWKAGVGQSNKYVMEKITRGISPRGKGGGLVIYFQNTFISQLHEWIALLGMATLTSNTHEWITLFGMATIIRQVHVWIT